MKIAFVADVLFPFSMGGSEIRNYEVGKRLVKRGHEVHMFGIKYWEGDDILVYEGIILHGVADHSRVYDAKGKRKTLSTVFFSLRMFKALLREKFDIVDVLSFVFTNCYVTKVITLLKKEKLVFTWQQYLGTYLFGYFGICNGLIAFLLEYFSILLTDRHIVVSDYVRKDLLRRGIRRQNTFLIENGVDIQATRVVPKEAKIYDLIFVGRLTYQKNLILLIDTVALLKNDLPNIKICIVGDGDQRQQLVAETQKKGLSGHFDFKGREDDRKKVFSLMKQSRIFILTSLLEGLPLTAIEANACGIPVLTTKTKWNNIDDFLEKNGRSGISIVANAIDLAKNIVDLLKDKDRLEEFSKNGLEKTMQYDWDRVTQKTEEFYQGILK